MMEEEARELENQQMVALMKKYEDEDRAKAERRKIDVARSKVEIMEANAVSIRRKDDAKKAEVAEMEYLMMYQVGRNEGGWGGGGFTAAAAAAAAIG